MKSLFLNRVKKISIAACSAALVCAVYADTTHVVQKGETLYSLSRQYGTTVDNICKANGIADGSSVKAGLKLIIPSAQSAQPAQAAAPLKPAQTISAASQKKSHVVQKGETWYGISRTYGIAVADLQAANNAAEGSVLKAGQTLVIPMDSSIVSAVASAAKEKTPAPAKSAAQTQSQTASQKQNAKVDVPDLKTADPRSYSAKKGDSSLVWPVKAPAVTYVNGKVSGVNLSAQKNESVTAIREGTVMFSGLYRGFGNVVFVQSKTGHIYAYTGLGSVRVNKGEYISYGQQLGTAGVDSISEKPQVSLMVFQNGLPIDPAKAPRG